MTNRIARWWSTEQLVMHDAVSAERPLELWVDVATLIEIAEKSLASIEANRASGALAPEFAAVADELVRQRETWIRQLRTLEAPAMWMVMYPENPHRGDGDEGAP